MADELTRIRAAVAELKRFGLLIDSFTVDLRNLDVLDNFAITAINLSPNPDPFPVRTIMGIPVNVKR